MGDNMPVKMRKLPGKNKYRVYDGNMVASKETTKVKAMKQVRLLRGISHGMKVNR
jgi:hypothetical protein